MTDDTPHPGNGTVTPIAGHSAWRACDSQGRLIGVYPTEAAARQALTRGTASDGVAPAAECTSPPCLGCFD